MELFEVGKLLLLSIVLGLIIGIEREYLAGKSAGTRTYALICFGSTLFTLISRFGFLELKGVSLDPSRIAAGIVVGIGFLGAGVIILHREKGEDKILGLTTAASIWASAAIGMALGVGWIKVALLGTFLIVFVLGGIGWIEKAYFEKYQKTK